VRSGRSWKVTLKSWWRSEGEVTVQIERRFVVEVGREGRGQGRKSKSMTRTEGRIEVGIGNRSRGGRGVGTGSRGWDPASKAWSLSRSNDIHAVEIGITKRGHDGFAG